MSDNPMKDYVDNFRANLPSGVTYDSDIARYFANGKRFLNEWEVERYIEYIQKFGSTLTAPATMTAPSLTGGTESASLTLGPAPDDGGAAITGYSYEVTDSADTGFASPVAQGTQAPANLGTSIEISPLNAGDYIARQRATNSVGSGSWSPASAAASAAPAVSAFSLNDPVQEVRFFDSQNILANAFSSGFSIFFDGEIEDTSDSSKHEIIQFNGPDSVRILVQDNKLRVSNWQEFTDSDIILTAGRVKFVVSYDGTTLSALIKQGDNPIDSSLSNNVGFTRGRGGGLQIYRGLPVLKNIRATTFWVNGNTLTQAQAELLLNEEATPADIPLAPFVDMSFEDKNVVNTTGLLTPVRTAGPFIEMKDNNNENFVPFILKSPETGEPVQQDLGDGLKYYGVASKSTGVSVYSSTDLISWALVQGDILLPPVDFPGVTEFLYLGDEQGSHNPYMMWVLEPDTQSPNSGINLFTSSDLINWTADASNPVFNRTTVGSQAEDFRVVKLGASNWAAYYEQDGVQGPSALAVGAAQNTNTVPEGIFSNVTDDILVDIDPVVGSRPFHANPGATRIGDKVYLFYEVVQFGKDGEFSLFGPTEFLRVANVEDALTPGAFSKRGCVMQAAAADGATLFANPTYVQNGTAYRGAFYNGAQTSPYSDRFYVEIDETVFGTIEI